MSFIVIPGVGKFHALKPGKIHLRCQRCKKTLSNMDRHEFDLEGSAVIITSYCDRCDRGGEFEDSQYFDLNGNVINP